MTEHYPIRPITPDEFDAFHLVDQHAFHGSPPSATGRARILSRFEFDRSLAAFDGSTPVGIAGAFGFRMRLPGASAPVAAVSWVGVLPTYRRQGILTQIMRRQLTDIRERGEALAVLWASESAIYGRYGYGRATWHDTFTIQRGEGRMAPDLPGDPRLRLRITRPDEVRAELAKVYDTVLEIRPGFFARSNAWWNRILDDPETDRKNASPLRCVLAEDDAGPCGYALYSGVGRWDDDRFLPDAQLDIRDLVTTIRAAVRPVDDPLLFQLADPRRLRPVVTDGLWARITDLPAALTLRRYASPVDVIIEVQDDLFPANAGPWHLQADESGTASCDPVDKAADKDAGLSLGITELGAAFFGGTRLGALAAAGRVTQQRAGALARLSAAMSWDPAPWCPVIF